VTARLYIRSISGLADRFGLAIYDAFCLELARRRNLPLASFDKEQRVAASSA